MTIDDQHPPATYDKQPDILRKYKRGFFVEWRVADRHKRDLFDRIDYLLDTNTSIRDAGLITGDAFRAALASASTAPLRALPFFDPDRVHADLWSSSFRPPFVVPDDPSTSVMRGLAALAPALQTPADRGQQ